MDYDVLRGYIRSWLQKPPVDARSVIRSMVAPYFARSLLHAIDEALNRAMGSDEATTVAFLKRIDLRLRDLAALQGKNAPTGSYAARSKYWRMIAPDARTIAELIASESNRLHEDIRNAVAKLAEERLEGLPQGIRIVAPAAQLAKTDSWDPCSRTAAFEFPITTLIESSIIIGDDHAARAGSAVIPQLVSLYHQQLLQEIREIADSLGRQLRCDTAPLTDEMRQLVADTAFSALSSEIKRSLEHHLTNGKCSVRLAAEPAVSNSLLVGPGTRKWQAVDATILSALHLWLCLTLVPKIMAQIPHSDLVSRIPSLLLVIASIALPLAVPMVLRWRTQLSGWLLKRKAVARAARKLPLVLTRRVAEAIYSVANNITNEWIESVLATAAVKTSPRPIQQLYARYKLS